jgi:hypothetical protein
VLAAFCWSKREQFYGSELVRVLSHFSPSDGVLALVHIRTAIAQHEDAIVGMAA